MKEKSPNDSKKQTIASDAEQCRAMQSKKERDGRKEILTAEWYSILCVAQYIVLMRTELFIS